MKFLKSLFGLFFALYIPLTHVIIWTVIGLFVLIVVTVGLFIALSANPTRTANLRDIVIIVLAVITLITNIVISVLVASLIFNLHGLVGTVQSEIKPLLERANQTLQVVRNTTSLVNENIAGPAIKVASVLAGLRRGSKATKNRFLNRFGEKK